MFPYGISLGFHLKLKFALMIVRMVQMICREGSIIRPNLKSKSASRLSSR